jgi:hypothetical protein
LWTLFIILSFFKHNVSRTGPLSTTTMWKGRKSPTPFGPLERAILDHQFSTSALYLMTEKDPHRITHHHHSALERDPIKKKFTEKHKTMANV